MPNWFELDDKILNSHHLAVPLLDLAVARGLDQHKLLSGSGLFTQELSRTHVAISPKQLFALISNIEKYSTSRDIAFLMGHRLINQNQCAGARLLQQSKNPLQMLRCGALFHTRLFPFIQIERRYDQGKLYLLFRPAVSHQGPQQFLLEILLAAIVSQLKSALGFQVPMEFSFNFPRPRNIYQYEENLGHRLKFDQHLAMVSIEESWLYQTCGENRSLQRQHALNQARNQPRALAGFIQSMSLILGQSPSPTLDRLSQITGLSQATLKRKFKLHGCSFQQLSDEVKKQQAIFALQIQQSSNEHVAKGLNFTDLTNFRRAFKRWTGLTPKEVKCQS